MNAAARKKKATEDKEEDFFRRQDENISKANEKIKAGAPKKERTFIDFDNEDHPVERKMDELQRDPVNTLFMYNNKKKIVSHGGFLYFENPHTGKIEKIKMPHTLLTVEKAAEFRDSKIIKLYKKNKGYPHLKPNFKKK
jgi:hypothetical protein